MYQLGVVPIGGGHLTYPSVPPDRHSTRPRRWDVALALLHLLRPHGDEGAGGPFDRRPGGDRAAHEDLGINETCSMPLGWPSYFRPSPYDDMEKTPRA